MTGVARIAIAALFATLLLFFDIAAAQTLDGRPVKIFLPVPPVGSTDVPVRILGPFLSDAWNAPVVPENRPGASGVIAALATVTAKPDGKTLFLGSPTTMVINPHILPQLPYKPLKDFTPVAMIGTSFNVLLINPGTTPVKTVKELIEYSNSRPGKVFYASLGVGTTSFLAMEMLKAMQPFNINNVPFKGSGEVYQSLLSGEVLAYFDTGLSAMGAIRAGTLRPLAITTRQRSSLIPDVPTMEEAGFAGYDMPFWIALYGPAGMPPAIVAKYNADIGKALQEPTVREKFEQLAVNITPMSPEELTNFTQSEYTKWETFFREHPETLPK
jgi:tripartite-type tricarboxylate transporter receptor subunit TctC